MLALLVQRQADRQLTHLRGKLGRRFAYHRPFLSGVSASGNPEAVQLARIASSCPREFDVRFWIHKFSGKQISYRHQFKVKQCNLGANDSEVGKTS